MYGNGISLEDYLKSVPDPEYTYHSMHPKVQTALKKEAKKQYQQSLNQNNMSQQPKIILIGSGADTAAKEAMKAELVKIIEWGGPTMEVQMMKNDTDIIGWASGETIQSLIDKNQIDSIIQHANEIALAQAMGTIPKELHDVKFLERYDETEAHKRRMDEKYNSKQRQNNAKQFNKKKVRKANKNAGKSRRKNR